MQELNMSTYLSYAPVSTIEFSVKRSISWLNVTCQKASEMSGCYLIRTEYVGLT